MRHMQASSSFKFAISEPGMPAVCLLLGFDHTAVLQDLGGPFACHITGLSWIDACFDGCCNPCAFGPLGALLCIGGCNLCAAMFLKQNQRVR